MEKTYREIQAERDERANAYWEERMSAAEHMASVEGDYEMLTNLNEIYNGDA